MCCQNFFHRSLIATSLKIDQALARSLSQTYLWTLWWRMTKTSLCSLHAFVGSQPLLLDSHSHNQCYLFGHHHLGLYCSWAPDNAYCCKFFTLWAIISQKKKIVLTLRAWETWARMCEQCEKLERRFFTKGSVKGGVEVAAAARLEPCCSTCWLGCRPALAHL